MEKQLNGKMKIKLNNDVEAFDLHEEEVIVQAEEGGANNEHQENGGVNCEAKNNESQGGENKGDAEEESQNEENGKGESKDGEGKDGDQKENDKEKEQEEKEEKKEGEGNGGGGESEPEEKEFIIDLSGIDFKKMFHESFDQYIEKNQTEIVDSRLVDFVEQAVSKLKPVVIKVGDRKEIRLLERLHKSFKECLFLAQHERQLFIAGAAGAGKTTLAAQIAKALELPYAQISCSAGMSEAHLLGRMLFDGSYVGSDFVSIYENGGVFLLDEIDAADANTMLVINSALANGVLSVPNRKDNNHAKRHPDFICIVSGNTWGFGSYEYHGRNHLDAAFLDRFAVSRVEIDYDVELEKEICGEQVDACQFLHLVREACLKYKIRRVVSTRAFISTTRQLIAGEKFAKIMDRFFTGWTKEEIAKVQNYIKDKKIMA